MVAERMDDDQVEEALVHRHEAVGGPCLVVRCSHGEVLERPLPTEAARLSDADLLFRALVRHYGTIGCPCARHLWDRLHGGGGADPAISLPQCLP